MQLGLQPPIVYVDIFDSLGSAIAVLACVPVAFAANASTADLEIQPQRDEFATPSHGSGWEFAVSIVVFDRQRDWLMNLMNRLTVDFWIPPTNRHQKSHQNYQTSTQLGPVRPTFGSHAGF